MTKTVFISHKNTDDSNNLAADLQDGLEASGYNVFNDATSIKPGDDWFQTIVKGLLSSDVIIVILDEKTAVSDWVQREVDMAKARGIALLPIAIGGYEAVEKSLERFALVTRQFYKFEGGSIKERQQAVEEIVGRIPTLAEITQEEQKRIIEAMREKQSNDSKRVGDNNPNRVTFTHPKIPNITFYLATGDASRITKYDILVNTENTYMQMARFFETRTLSYAIRRYGANIRSNVTLLEDTIQDQLYANAIADGGLPVREGQVLVTSAGHPKSKLKNQRRTNYRYIFHVAAVRVDLKEKDVIPIDTIDAFVNNVLDRVDKLEEDEGHIILGNGETLYEPQEEHKPIESILFPAFGTGKGGKRLDEVAQDIAKCFEQKLPTYLEDIDTNINKIGWSVFFEDDVEMVTDIFKQHGFVVESDSPSD